MNRTESQAPHIVELLILLVWLLLEAIAALAVALLALVLTVAGWRRGQLPAEPASSPASRRRQRGLPAAAPAPAPAVHPLALVAGELEALPVRLLRPMAPPSCRRLPKARLIEELLVCG
jgi:hypothetical protein